MPELGSKITLISKADIRYEGRLFTVDPQECTIALANGKKVILFTSFNDSLSETHFFDNFVISKHSFTELFYHFNILFFSFFVQYLITW